MNQPLFNSVRCGAAKFGATMWVALLTMLCMLGLAAPSQAQVSIAFTGTSSGSTFERNEGSQDYNFRINVGGTGGQRYRVSYRTWEGPIATGPNADKYWATSAGTLSQLDFQRENATIDLNANSNGTITITVYGDTHYEDDEYFNVQLTGVQNISATPSGPTPQVNPGFADQAEAVIRNDDSVPNLSINVLADKGPSDSTVNYADSAVPELDSGQSNNLTFYVTADRINGKGSTGTWDFTTDPPTPTPGGGDDQTFIYFSSNGTAIAGSDYFATNQTVTIPFNTMTLADDFTQPNGVIIRGNSFRVGNFQAAHVPITVATIGDVIDEGNETVNVTIQAVAGGNAIIDSNNSTIAGTILDDDAPRASIADATVTEGDSGVVTASFAVTLDAPSPQAIQINYTTIDFTAVSVVHGSQVQTITFTGKPATGGYRLGVSAINFGVPGTVQTTGVLPHNADATAIRTALANLPNMAANDIISVTAPSGTDDTITVVFRSTLNRTFAPIVFTPVNLQDSNGNPLSATVSITNSGLTLPPNYQSKSGTITFAPGQTTQFITVDVLGNTIPEGEDAVNRFLRYFVRISVNNNQGNSSLGVEFDRNRATGIINDNDSLSQLTFVRDLVTHEGNLDANGQPQVTSADFVVQLQNQSGLDVTVQYATTDGTAKGGSAGTAGASNNPTDYQTTAGTLKFAPGEVSKTISVPIFGDNLDELDETFFINLLNPTNASLLKSQARNLIIDDDGPVVSVSNANPVNEGNSGTTAANFTLTLSAATGQPVVVYLQTSDVTAISAPGGAGLNSQDYQPIGAQTPMAVTFAPGETTKVVTVLVNGDVFYENDETFKLNIVSIEKNPNDPTNTVSPASIGVAQAFGTIRNDDPQPTITISDAPLDPAITEGDAGQQNFVFNVQLSAVTFQSVSFNYGTSDGTATLADNDYLQRAGQVSFAPGETTKTILIPVVGDTKKEADETFNVVIDKDSVVNANANSPVSDLTGVGTIRNDDQDPAGFTITPTTLTTSESGTTATFTVRPTRQPSADVQIQLTSSDTTEGLVSAGGSAPAPTVILTFTPQNYAQAQTVTVLGVDDTVADGDVTYLINSENAQSTDALYAGLNPVDVAVTNTDNEVPGFQVSKTSLTTTEDGGTDTFTVRLNVAPTANVTIPVSSSNTNEGRVSPTSLVFTPANFATPQTVTVTGQNDTVRDGDQAYTIVLGAATSTDGRYSGLNPDDISATNIDNETPGIVVTPTSGLTTTEGGGTATFTVQLSTAPTANVTIALRSSNTNEGTVSPNSLTFTPANWNVPRTVTVTGVEDNVDDGDQTFTIITDPAVSTDADYNGLNAPDVSVTNKEVALILVAPVSGLRTTEAGGTVTLRVSLNKRPAQDVTVTVVSSDTTEGRVAPATLTFTAANYNTAQLVTVTGVDDDIDDDDQTYTVTATANSADPAYNALAGPVVTLVNTDDDTRGITISPTSGLITTEAGASTTFTVVLNTRPLANVRIPLRTSNQTEGRTTVANVVFTPTNWDTPQRITIIGLNDSIADGNQGYTIITDPAVSPDAKYSGLNAEDITVTNIDDDKVGVVVSPISGLNTTEAGGQTSFTIRLTSQPTQSVTIDVGSNDVTEGVTTDRRVTFLPGTPPAGSAANVVKWNTNVRVTVRGIDDSIEDGHVSYRVVTGSAVSNDPNYSGLAVPDVYLRNLDNDDKTAPRVTITNPRQDAAYRQITQVTGTVLDPNNPNYRFVSGVNRVQVRLTRQDNPATTQNEFGHYNPINGQYEAQQNQAQLMTASYTASNGTWRVNLPTSGTPASLASGRYRVVAFAYDNAGNEAAAGANFSVDNALPTVAITIPAEGTVANTVTQVRGTAQDNAGGSGIARVELVVFRRADTANGIEQGYLAADGSFRSTATRLRANGSETNGVYNWAFGLPSLLAASYQVRAYAIDNAGNQSLPDTRNFTVRGSGGEDFSGNVTYFISVPYMDFTGINATTKPSKAFSVPPVDPFTREQNYILQRYNPLTLQYEDLGNDDLLKRGEGYLLRPVKRGVRILRPSEDPTRKPLADTIREFQITLRINPSIPANDERNGYNLIGNPFDPAKFAAAEWLNSRVTATIGGQTFTGTVAQAADRNILDRRLFTFNEATGNFEPVSGNLLPLKGYFVRTFVDGVQVNLKAIPNP